MKIKEFNKKSKRMKHNENKAIWLRVRNYIEDRIANSGTISRNSLVLETYQRFNHNLDEERVNAISKIEFYVDDIMGGNQL